MYEQICRKDTSYNGSAHFITLFWRTCQVKSSGQVDMRDDIMLTLNSQKMILTSVLDYN